MTLARATWTPRVEEGELGDGPERVRPSQGQVHCGWEGERVIVRNCLAVKGRKICVTHPGGTAGAPHLLVPGHSIMSQPSQLPALPRFAITKALPPLSFPFVLSAHIMASMCTTPMPLSV